MKRSTFLGLLNFLCCLFGIVMEIKNLRKFDSRWDKQKPFVRSDGLFRSEIITPHQWIHAFSKEL